MEASEREKTLLETDNRRLKREVKSLRMRVDAMLDSSFSAAQSPSFSLAGPKSPSFAATTLGERIREEEGRTRTGVLLNWGVVMWEEEGRLLGSGLDT
jgi:hypothetical protein